MSRAAFELGKGGCSCPSCANTAQFQDKGFAAWPRGNPAGRRSAAEYAAHVAHSRTGGGKGFHFDISPEPVFARLPDLVMPIAPNAIAIRWNAARGTPYKSKGPETRPNARPSQGSSPAAHFQAGDRTGETAKIYAMPKAEKKRAGRPALEGRRVVIKLPEHLIERAVELGGGGTLAMSRGIRTALESAPLRKRSA